MGYPRLESSFYNLSGMSPSKIGAKIKNLLTYSQSQLNTTNLVLGQAGGIAKLISYIFFIAVLIVGNVTTLQLLLD